MKRYRSLAFFGVALLLGLVTSFFVFSWLQNEKNRLMEYLAAKKSARAQAVQDVAWALMNAKEFEFNH